MNPTYRVITSRVWRHASGRTASIYGACPWPHPSDQKNWQTEDVGFTVQNMDTGAVGIGRVPWKTQEEAQAWVDKEHARLDEIRQQRQARA